MSAWAAGFALAIALLSAGAFFRLRGTTLSAPAIWAGVAALALAAVHVGLSWHGDWEHSAGASLARYAAAVGTFCPLMAVLGAKRPQDRGWQWVVLSLWIVLLVPAGQAWLARAGGEFRLPLPWRCLLGALLILGPLNYLPTRWAVSAMLAAAAQFRLVDFWMRGSVNLGGDFGALLLLLIAALLPTLATRPLRRAASEAPLDALSARWRHFRDGWGAFWGLRILNRVNEAAQQSGWPVRLTWSGFAAVDPARAAISAVDDRVLAHITQTMDSLLRRFERHPSPPS